MPAIQKTIKAVNLSNNHIDRKVIVEEHDTISGTTATTFGTLTAVTNLDNDRVQLFIGGTVVQVRDDHEVEIW